jgi:hypothetical protein
MKYFLCLSWAALFLVPNITLTLYGGLSVFWLVYDAVGVGLAFAIYEVYFDESSFANSRGYSTLVFCMSFVTVCVGIAFLDQGYMVQFFEEHPGGYRLNLGKYIKYLEPGFYGIVPALFFAISILGLVLSWKFWRGSIIPLTVDNLKAERDTHNK